VDYLPAAVCKPGEAFKAFISAPSSIFQMRNSPFQAPVATSVRPS
jgi:hypothetical protein